MTNVDIALSCLGLALLGWQAFKSIINIKTIFIMGCGIAVICILFMS